MPIPRLEAFSKILGSPLTSPNVTSYGRHLK